MTLRLLLLALLVAPGVARGEETHWYGWQILAADGASVAVALAAPSRGVGYLGVATFLVAGPVIHGLHDQGGRAAGSLALRVALPTAGAVVGLSMCGDGDGSFACYGVSAVVAGTGVAVASLLDVAFLAHEPRARERAPAFSVGAAPRPEGGWTLGLGGTF